MQTYIQKPNIVTRQIAGETLLVPISGNLADMQKLFTLADVGATIWERLDGRHDSQQICDAIMARYEIDRQTAMDDLHRFIDELLSAGLIESRGHGMSAN